MVSERPGQDGRRHRAVAATGFFLALLLVLFVYWTRFLKTSPYKSDKLFLTAVHIGVSLQSG